MEACWVAGWGLIIGIEKGDGSGRWMMDDGDYWSVKLVWADKGCSQGSNTDLSG